MGNGDVIPFVSQKLINKDRDLKKKNDTWIVTTLILAHMHAKRISNFYVYAFIYSYTLPHPYICWCTILHAHTEIVIHAQVETNLKWMTHTQNYK